MTKQGRSPRRAGGGRRRAKAQPTPGVPEPAAPATGRDHPSAFKLIAAVALIVALDILLFFAIGYLIGTQIL